MNPLIIKLGGVLLDSEEALERLFTALVNYREAHQRPLIIVHGGGCVVDELMKQLNLPVQKKNGLRVTPAEQIDIITGALAGTANKTLLAWAKKHGISSVGLFLGDGDSVKVTQLDAELGHVGLAQPGSPALINTLLAGGYLPVVSSIGVTDEGQLMNVNADQAATALAATLGADLILLSDVSGILDGKGQRIAEMTAEKAEQLIEQGIITDGMIVKVNAALDAARLWAVRWISPPGVTPSSCRRYLTARRSAHVFWLKISCPAARRLPGLQDRRPSGTMPPAELTNKGSMLWHFGAGVLHRQQINGSNSSTTRCASTIVWRSRISLALSPGRKRW